MSPSSSTFSSRRGAAYAWRVVAIAGGLALLLAGTAMAGIWSGLAGWRESALLQDRLGKLDHPDFDARIVFVGDSTLGNAIDARLFGELAGQPTVNLALNAQFGFAGTANMIERAAAHPSVRTVVVFQAADMMARIASPLGDLRTRPTASFGVADWLETLRSYFDWRMIQATAVGLWRAARGVDRPRAMVDDYIEQSADPRITELDIARLRRQPLVPEAIDRSAVADFARVAEACRGHGLRCLYVHGPLYDAVCAASRPYMAEVDRIVAAAGLEVVEGAPVCLPRDKLGDTVDHYRPGLKREGTTTYFGLLAPYLAAG